MSKSKSRPCKVRRASVCTGTAAPGRKYCRACLVEACAINARYRAKHLERVRKKTREDVLAYLTAETPRARAYQERSKICRLRSTAKWVARNPDRKALLNRLNNAVAAGEIVKPAVCTDCSKPKKLVGWGIAEDDDDGIKVEAWCCWGCWWRRKRAAEGRE